MRRLEGGVEERVEGEGGAGGQVEGSGGEVPQPGREEEETL